MTVDPWHRRLLGWLLGWFIRLLALTVRKRVEGEGQFLALREAGHQVVFSFWHGRQFMLLGDRRGTKAVVMVSLSHDGTLQKAVLERYGFHIIRGSVTRRGRTALREMIRLMKEEGYDSVIAVDGPSGPRGVVKPGATLLASSTGAYLVPTSAALRHCWRLSSWDRMEIPLPFTTGWIVYGEPLQVPSVAGGRQEALETLQQRIDEATRRADERVVR